MRKVILAKLTLQDSEEIQSSDRIYRTFKSLLQNQFISEEKKSDIAVEMQKSLLKSREVYKAVMLKYNIPYSIDVLYNIDPITDELYVYIN